MVRPVVTEANSIYVETIPCQMEIIGQEPVSLPGYDNT